MADLGLDPETALKLILALLRGSAYFFAGFALLALSTYVVFLCLEIFASRPRSKAKVAEVPQPVGRTSVVKQTQDLVPAEIPTLAEEARLAGEEVLCEQRIRIDFPGTGIRAHRRPLGVDTSNV